jgi:DNA-binding NarL/FixJ family response regulator
VDILADEQMCRDDDREFPSMIRILLADDHEVVRRGLHNLLESRHADWQVCGEASTGREAVEMAVALKPDVAVLDLAMPELGGLEATRQIRRLVPQTEVLVFTMHENEQLVRDVLASGANGYVLKSETGQHLVAAVEALARHQPYVSGPIAETMLAALREERNLAQRAPAPESQLTVRQREIVQLLAEGKSTKEIASELRLSVKTVKTHRAAIMRRLGARSVVEIVHYAVRHELIAP